MRLFLTALVCALTSGNALAQNQQDWKSCEAEQAETALPACTRLIESGTLDDKKRVIAYDNRGVAHFRQADYDRAIADYTKAIEIDPKYARARMRRGAAYGMKGDHDQAIMDSTEALKLDPTDWKAYHNRANANERKGKYDEA